MIGKYKKRNVERIFENIRKVIKWCIRVWDDWVEEWNIFFIDLNDNFVIVFLSLILKIVVDYELFFWLSFFCFWGEEKNGSLFLFDFFY